MNINRNSFVITVAYFFTMEWDIPKRTSLCVLFWRTVLSALVMLAISAMIGTLLGILGAIVWEKPLEVASLVIAIVMVGAVGALCLRWVINRETSESQTLAGKYFRAVKDRVCPVVNIVRGQGDK